MTVTFSQGYSGMKLPKPLWWLIRKGGWQQRSRRSVASMGHLSLCSSSFGVPHYPVMQGKEGGGGSLNSCECPTPESTEKVTSNAPSRSMLTPGQPILTLTQEHQVLVREATRVSTCLSGECLNRGKVEFERERLSQTHPVTVYWHQANQS